MRIKAVLFISGILAWCSVASAQARSSVGDSAFERVPRQALIELKATVGRPFKAGVVFVNGKYLAPPYKVERFGTALRINGIQVTDQVISWDDFLKTQTGFKEESVAPSAEEEEEVVEEVVEEEDDSSSGGDDLDDLFSDNPAPKPKKTKRVRTVRKKKAAPSTKVTFDGEFKMNDRARLMVNRLNKLRTETEVTLRGGGCLFFSTRYSRISVDRGTTELLIDALPEVMKNNADYSGFSAAARSANLGYLPEAAIRELFRNRIDYLRLQERRRTMKEERTWEKLLR